jgi:ArsR family transcriptional regulator, virulence genes transcriptional regulator
MSSPSSQVEPAPLQAPLDDMKQHAQAAAALLKALANENRLMILCCLMASDGELCVGELNRRVPLSQSALSQHLASLREAGLVSTRKVAQTVYYRLEGDEARALIGLLQSIYCPTLSAD